MKLLNSYPSFDFSSNPITIGVEVEGLVPASLGRKGLAGKIGEFLRGRGYQASVSESTNDYGTLDFHVRFRKGDYEAEYQIKYDHSLPQSRDSEGAELMTPVLRTEDDEMLFAEVLGVARDAGLRALPKKAGVHVHVGFPDLSAEEVVAVKALYTEIEKELRQVFSVPYGRKGWIGLAPRSTRAFMERFIQNLDRREFRRWNLSQNRREIHDLGRALSPTRMTDLNFQPLDRFMEAGTGEFRIFNSTVDPAHIGIMTDFSKKLIAAVRSKDPRLLDYLSRTQAGRIRVKELALILDMKLAHAEKELEEIFLASRTALERKLGFETEPAIRILMLSAGAGAVVASAPVASDWIKKKRREAQGAPVMYPPAR